MIFPKVSFPIYTLNNHLIKILREYWKIEITQIKNNIIQKQEKEEKKRRKIMEKEGNLHW